MPSNHLIICCPLLLLPSVFPQIRVFPNESFLHIRWPKYWSFSFGISPSNEFTGLISFRIDWFDLAVQETLKSLLQHHCSKALRCSAFLKKKNVTCQKKKKKKKDVAAIKPSVTAVFCNGAPWRDSGWESKGYWPRITELQIKGVI